MKWYNIPPKRFIKWVLIPPAAVLLLLLADCGWGGRTAAEFFAGWWPIPVIAYELIFVFSWRICEADEHGVWVRSLLGGKRGGTWHEFVYVGLVSRTRTPDRASDEKSEWVLICARKMPYKGHPTDEGYLLHKGTILLPRTEESQTALKTFCPYYSEALYVGTQEI